ncbi:MAG: T9SS type A sorting domain-containing protein [Tannerellaceae bacterium]|jgi:hypothetical protein|nr:T9SS type A sorting domain-containing protein [Tannerellaceae bacterium]
MNKNNFQLSTVSHQPRKFRVLRAICSVLLLALSVVPLSAQSNVVLRNSGAMYVGGDASSTGLYIQGDFAAHGASDIEHPGKTVLTGDFINNTTGTSKVFTSTSTGRSGVFEFRAEKIQQIKASASKSDNYILFPYTVIINNKDSILMASTAAANMKNIVFTRGKLVLDSEVSVADESRHAHLWLEDGAAPVANTDSKSNIQVNFAIGNREGRLVGFTTPFETLYADYFFFNFLSIPSELNLFSDGKGNEMWNTNPNRVLKAGEGYILGQVLVPYNEDQYYIGHLDPKWAGAKKTDMTRNKFVFNRHWQKNKSFGNYVTAVNRFTGEKLVNEDVKLTLQHGYNYFGNPFMVPLDLSDLITGNRSDWGINGGDVNKNYYILAKGATGKSDDAGFTFQFNATYLVGQAEGSTAQYPPGRNHLIAPMQMFVIQNKGPQQSNFTIPRKKRTHGDISFFRSALPEEPHDELLIETRDTKTGGFDRLCVVFRPEGSYEATDPYDAEKLFNRTGGVNQIYTRSSDGKLLTTNVLPATTSRLPFYFEPSLEVQEVELEATRIESLRSVSNVVLEDTKTNKKVDLMRESLYRFTSYPGDKPTRFILHFTSVVTGEEEIAGSASWHAIYQNGVTTLYGIDDKSMGETVSLYNTKGQFIAKTKVTGNTLQIKRHLPIGVYFINLRGQTIKLVVND